jgi:hypothetical protein
VNGELPWHTLLPAQNVADSPFLFVTYHACIAALMALKRKKQFEGQIEKISGSRLTIETQVMAIENANVNLETMKAMRAGAEAMKGIHGAM